MLINLPVSKLIFGDGSKESIIEIPQGQLYLVRPLSVKGYSELIFKDGAASIRRTGQEFQYQLVIQRAYEEGEEELLGDEDEDAGATEGLGGEKDEKTFLLDEAIQFRSDLRENGETVFAWRDLTGEPGDLWQFVCDSKTQGGLIATFEAVAAQCQYERKHRKSHEQATEEELREFSFEDEPIPSASPALSPTLRSPNLSPSPTSTKLYLGSDPQLAPTSPADDNMPRKDPVKAKAAASSAEDPEGEILAQESAELHLFDFETGAFIIQDREVRAIVSETGNWKYRLHIKGDEKDWLTQEVGPEINPVFNFEYLSFIFNHYVDDGSVFSWLLRFKDQPTEERFQEGLMQALWEHLNEVKWAKTKDTDRDYVTEAFQDLTMEDADAEEEEEEESEVEEDEGHRSEHYDSDESQDDVETQDADGNVNSQLAVGYKHDRSFVVRGSKIGVFKHTPDNHLEFTTNISKVQTPKGKLFNPKKIMLHTEDRDMILQNGDDPNSLYRMDLEYGKIVDEWKVHDDIPVVTFAPTEASFSDRIRTS